MKKKLWLIFLILLIFSGYCFSEELKAPPSPTFPPKITQPEEQPQPPQQEETSPTQEENIKTPPKIPGLEPPPSVKLNIPPPKNVEEAVKRINDFKIFRRIVPPGTSPQYLEKTFFGKYRNVVKPYIQDDEPIEPEEVIQEIESENKNEKKVKNYEYKKSIKKVKKREINLLPSKKLKEKPITQKNKAVYSKKEVMEKYTEFTKQEKNKILRKKNNKVEIKQIKEKEKPSYLPAVILTLIILGGIGYYFFVRRNG